MPRVKSYLTPSEYAVLGFMRQRPTYGYELQRRFAGGQGLARVCPIEPAMVYAILKSLSGLELIDGEWDRSVYPPRAVYVATEEGETAFERWLRQPVRRIREVRLDFMVKLYFALNEDPRLAGELIEAQIEACEAYRRDMEKEASAAEASSFDGIVLSSKTSAVEQTLRWLHEVRRLLAGRS